MSRSGFQVAPEGIVNPSDPVPILCSCQQIMFKVMAHWPSADITTRSGLFV